MCEYENNEKKEDQQHQGFEKDLERLEKIVAQLEQGSLPLDESLKLYEEGIKTYKRCRKLLKNAESRVVKLVESLEGELDEEVFDSSELENKS